VGQKALAMPEATRRFRSPPARGQCMRVISRNRARISS